MTDMSPAACAVLAAMRRSYDHVETRRSIAADVLRALANHKPHRRMLNRPLDWWDPDDRTRRELRNLADELEFSQP